MPVTDTTCPIRYQDVVSPTLRDDMTATKGHYNVNYVWNFDASSNLPVGMSMNVTFPS